MNDCLSADENGPMTIASMNKSRSGLLVSK